MQVTAIIGPAGGRTTSAAISPQGAERYRADWRVPGSAAAGPVPAPAPVPIASIGPVRTDRPGRTDHNALLAEDVYRADPTPPPGTRVAGQAELDRLGLTPDMLEQPGQSSFRARVYVSGAPGHEHYTIAFRGTKNADDWKANLRQGTGQQSIHYRNALAIGRQVARSGADVEMTGHSLGGGLAAAAALASGRHADTFNAAGLHDATITRATAIARGAGRQAGSADNYRVPGEILTFVQEGGDHVLGGLIGGVVGAIMVDAPPAFGQQHTLDLVVPAGKDFFAEHSRLDRHGMEWVLASIGAHARR